MKKLIKNLIFAYLIIVIVKSILTYIIPAPSAFSDGYIYAKLARSFFLDQNFVLHGSIYNHYLPLYSIVLSPAYLLGKMSLIYPAMKIINSIISSLIIFPAFYLAKEFISPNKAFYTSLLISFLPSNLIFSSYLLSENIFYFLFLLSIYLIYKSSTTNSLYYPVFAGMGVGLTYLAKINGIALFAVLGTLFLYNLIKKEKTYLRNIVLTGIIALLVISPWIIRSYNIEGTLFGGYSSEAATILDINEFILKFIIQFLLYSGLLVISTGIIFPMLITRKIFNKKTLTFSVIALSSIFFILLIASNHNVKLSHETVSYELPSAFLPWLAGRLIGRYIDAVLPLVIILGMICIKEKLCLKKTLAITILLIFSSQLILSGLLPINHVSVAYFGLISYVLDFPINMILMAAILALVPLIIYKLKLDFKKIIVLFSVFFVLVSLLNFSMIYYNSNTFWYKGDQVQLGIWLDSYDPERSIILFDERDCTERILKEDQRSICEPSSGVSILGFWLNDDLKAGDPETEDFDFLISKHELTTLKKVKSSSTGIHIYKNESNNNYSSL